MHQGRRVKGGLAYNAHVSTEPMLAHTSGGASLCVYSSIWSVMVSFVLGGGPQ